MRRARTGLVAALAMALATATGCADRSESLDARLDRIEARLDRLDERLSRADDSAIVRSAPAADTAGNAAPAYGAARQMLDRMDPARRARLQRRVARLRESADRLAERTGTQPGTQEFQRELVRELARRLRARTAPVAGEATAPPTDAPAEDGAGGKAPAGPG